MNKRLFRPCLSRKAGVFFALALPVATQAGCAVVAIADAAVTVGAVAVKTTGKVAGAAVDVATYPLRRAENDEDESE